MRTRLHKQTRVNTCAVACLRTILDVQLGVKVAEVGLEAHGTSAKNSIKKEGTDTTQLRAMMKGVNRTHNEGKLWRLRVRSRGTVAVLKAQLAAGRIPMVSVWEPNDSCNYHMIVVLAVQRKRIKIFDPDPKQITSPHWIGTDDFEFWWHSEEDGTTWYAVINAD